MAAWAEQRLRATPPGCLGVSSHLHGPETGAIGDVRRKFRGCDAGRDRVAELHDGLPPRADARERDRFDLGARWSIIVGRDMYDAPYHILLLIFRDDELIEVAGLNGEVALQFLRHLRQRNEQARTLGAIVNNEYAIVAQTRDDGEDSPFALDRRDEPEDSVIELEHDHAIGRTLRGGLRPGLLVMGHGHSGFVVDRADAGRARLAALPVDFVLEDRGRALDHIGSGEAELLEHRLEDEHVDSVGGSEEAEASVGIEELDRTGRFDGHYWSSLNRRRSLRRCNIIA